MDLDPWNILSILSGGNPLSAIGFLTIFISVGIVPLFLSRFLALLKPSRKPSQQVPQLESKPPERAETLRRWKGYIFWGTISMLLYILIFLSTEVLADINLLVQAFLAGSVFLITAFGLLAVYYWMKTRDSNDPSAVPANRLRGYVMGPVIATIGGFIGINVLYHRGPRLEIPFLIVFIILFSSQNIRRAFRT